MIKIKQLFIIVILLYINTSCITTNKLTGTYQYLVPNWINGKLTLNVDSTFIYELNEGKIDFVTKGTWNYKNKLIILNSYTQPPLDSIIVNEFVLDSLNNKSFKVVDFMEIPLSQCILTLNSNPDFHVKIDSNGIGNKDFTNKINTIGIYCLTDNYQYKVKNNDANYFEIEVYYNISPFARYFTNEEWRYEKGKIYCVSCEEQNILYWEKIEK